MTDKASRNVTKNVRIGDSVNPPPPKNTSRPAAPPSPPTNKK